MAVSHILGFPRIGEKRELKQALEAYWQAATTDKAPEALATLQQTGRELRARHWAVQKKAGIDFVAAGDFAWYDQVLSTLVLLGAIPQRFEIDPKNCRLNDTFTMARGNAQHTPLAMTKWFDTNYHYLVPEWTTETTFDGGMNSYFDDIIEAQSLQHRVKAVLIGPLTLLYLGKIKAAANGTTLHHALDLLPQALAAYQRVLTHLKQLGVEWVQIDEPILSLDLDQKWQDAFVPTYAALSQNSPAILLATYFESVQHHAALIKQCAVAGIHLDAVRGAAQVATFAQDLPSDKVLSIGIIDGRNIWRADLDKALDVLAPLAKQLGERLWIAPSCSLLHVPFDVALETKLSPEIKNWLAFAHQKLDEITLLKNALHEQATQLSTDVVTNALAEARDSVLSRQQSALIHNPIVQKKLLQITANDAKRDSVFAKRIKKQHAKYQLPLFPTTTIGSFPQTAQIRQIRANFKRGQLSNLDYLDQMRAQISHVIQLQEQFDLDVLVHGEAERGDMVEYFGEHLQGFAISQLGWVQSYGSRCVKPPIIYGDVTRIEAITVTWSRYAQSLTKKPVKGMLTGPITMLQWSFVRDDQPRQTTALQIALALRDEVTELEQAGIGKIQIDEPALREGLPLKRAQWDSYLDGAVFAFKVASSKVFDTTQIHTHMCYSEFNDILPWIAALDADVITIETSRSDMTLLAGFGDFNYPNDIGPGVYDIHSPRVPSVEGITYLLQQARKVIPDERLWVNPDCGLKTRAWDETAYALKNMVKAAKLLRAEVAQQNEA